LRGKLTNTDLEIEGARDFYGTPLNLALAGAALLTRQAPEKSPLPGQKQQDKVKAATLQAREWSAAAKRNQFPIVSPVGPSESEMGVVIPIDKNTVRHFTLEPAA
jgi:hypothetical protein